MFLLLTLLGFATTSTAIEWHHLMTIDPNDGKISWDFISEFWYTGDFGKDPDHDFINDTVRHFPMDKIRVEVKNGAGQVVSKTFTVDTAHRGWSFYDLMANGFNEEFTSDMSLTGSTSGFESCPIISIGGNLRANYLNGNDGVRLLCSSQDPPSPTIIFSETWNNKIYGLGINYALVEAIRDDYTTSSFIQNLDAPMCRLVMQEVNGYKADVNLKNIPMSGQGTDRGQHTNQGSGTFLYKIYILPTEEPEVAAKQTDVEAMAKLIEELSSRVQKIEGVIGEQTDFSCSEESVASIRSLSDLYVKSFLAKIPTSELISCVFEHRAWALMVAIPMD